MQSLIQHDVRRDGGRDSISLYFEYKDLKNVIVHRQFYKFEEFSSFILNPFTDLRKLDFFDVQTSVDIENFNVLVKRIIRRFDRQGDSNVSSQINQLLLDYRIVTERRESEESMERYLDHLNLLFYRFRYSIKDKAFVLDTEVTKAIDSLVQATSSRGEEVNYSDLKEQASIPDIFKDEADLYEFRVYDVGQANCSALIKYDDHRKEDYEVVFVFDLGCDKTHKSNPELAKMLSKINSKTTILISHFDLDHINNITDNLYIMTSRWVFPDYDGNKKKASMVFQMLLRVATRKSYSGQIYDFPTPFEFSKNVCIWQNTDPHVKDPFQSTLINAQCLVARISINGIDLLIPADSLYEEFDEEAVLPNKYYDYILVPHHCCEYYSSSSAPNSAKIWKFVGKDTMGVLMCGKNNYGHANIDHLSWFLGKAFAFFGTKIYDGKKNELPSPTFPKQDYYPISFK